MRRSARWNVALNMGTAVVALAAAGTVVNDRLVPAWRDRQRLDPGDRVPAHLAFERLADGKTLLLPSDRPVLLLVFRSTCPACQRIAPSWAGLAEAVRDRAWALAVALEEPEPALAYALSRLPGTIPVRPVSKGSFVDLFRIPAVPTTLVIDGAGRLRLRRVGPLGAAEQEGIRSLVMD